MKVSSCPNVPMVMVTVEIPGIIAVDVSTQQ